jgi:Na+/H+-translocating membrane pyrophosphatase
MRAGVEVLRVAFERGAVAGFGLVELALLKINVAELRVMVGLVGRILTVPP